MQERELLLILKLMEKRLDALERLLKTQAGAGQTFHIENVETMNIKELVYRLEKVDVKQLSGTMNIGNTFHQAEQRTPPAENLSIQINGKNIPYQMARKPSPPQPAPDSSSFAIGDIHIGTIEDASAVNFGNNFPAHFSSSKKHNQGFGNILGDSNDIRDILSHQEENDAVELFSEQPDNPELLKWLKEKDEEGDDEDSNGEVGTQQLQDQSKPTGGE
ncbi:hypothetical protein GKZ89_14640 [Bacillus mangrovi]|uniref:Uncharacterized protein n=1 Tax=Metabacillus mangrovi TaxID=1491830 RepID=A0A7X2S6M9_9BACI|nr:hypothetical protein [Metabacillus mangrovi]MTH54639.1 hypothetical protein [Metabacillus mangrovi]